MSTESGPKRDTRNLGDGVTMHFIQRPDETNWRIDWFECTRLEGNPFDAIAELGPADEGVAKIGPASASLKSSPIIRAADMGWENESFATIEEACKFAKPRLPRFE